MTIEELRHLLKAGGSELGLTITDKETSLFLTYLDELTKWNKKVNLTSITDVRDVAIRHFLDSLTLAPFLAGINTLLDIGSGAGFPGIPLKIVRPDLAVTLMDSASKKVVFMRHVVRTLGLQGIEAVAMRAEDRAVVKKYEATFDAVTSRALTNLKQFIEIAAPYARNGGVLLAIKGPKGIEELQMLQGLKGVTAIQIKEVVLPFSDIRTTILCFKKTDR